MNVVIVVVFSSLSRCSVSSTCFRSCCRALLPCWKVARYVDDGWRVCDIEMLLSCTSLFVAQTLVLLVIGGGRAAILVGGCMGSARVSTMVGVTRPLVHATDDDAGPSLQLKFESMCTCYGGLHPQL